MDTRKIIAELRAERDRLNQAIAAIEAITIDGASRTATRQPRSAGAKPRRRRRISAAARKRLSQLMKQRWASGKMKPKRA